MESFSKILLLTLFFSAFTSCKGDKPAKISESSKKEVKQSKFAKNYPDFDFEHLKEVLQSQAQKDSLALPFYSQNEFTPVWVHDTLDTHRILDMIAILNKTNEHGLSSKTFPAREIAALTDSIDSGIYSNNMDNLYTKMAKLELLSTQTAIKYIIGMNYGFVNPKKLYKKDYDITVLSPDSAFYANLHSELRLNPIAYMLNSHPTDEVYVKLQEEYKILESKYDSEFKTITSDATYKLGDKSPHISKIAHRLILTGEYIPDSLSRDSLHQTLDKNLLAAVNTFRRRNSYPEETEVGKLTITALNRPLDYYIDKIRVNLERYRWKRSKPKNDKHIEVNVASAMLAATQQDSLPLIIKVCVGSIRNKTPLLQSNINYINLNPVWNVPTSIAQKEVAVLQKKDPTYIRRHNMRLYKGGKEVDAASVNWQDVDPSRFSYIIRQDPGLGNSLGLIKFMFNNSFSVYLHDTPSKSAFNKKNRAVSHGCVRVQKPFDLAFFCLSPTSNLYKDQLYYSVNKGPVSDEGKKLLKENKLKKISDIINPQDKISLSIDYYTTYMYANDDTIYYADDIYEYDDAILKALDPSYLPETVIIKK